MFRTYLVVAYRFICLVVPAVVIGASLPARPAELRATGASSTLTSSCPRPITSHIFIEPPDVDVRDLPIDANGDHELILIVHRDGDQFCYAYASSRSAQSMHPTLRVRRGEHFALRIVNEIQSPSRGARVASNEIPPCKPMAMPRMRAVAHVGYLNHVLYDRATKMEPVDTNIHLHGFEGPADRENVFLSTLSTPMHACEYSITIPLTQPPGTYFYHPHVHGVSEDEIAGGLSGAWIVEPDVAQIPRADEHVIVLRDPVPFKSDWPFVAPSQLRPLLLADARHEMMQRPAGAIKYDPFNPPVSPSAIALEAPGISLDSSGCDGFFPGPLITVNGAPIPVSLDVPAARPQLFRVINATADSIKLFKLRDAHAGIVPLEVVARDGTPLSGNAAAPLSRYAAMASLVLPPAGRADFLLTARAGQALTLFTDHACLGPIGEISMPHDLLAIHAVDSTRPSPAPIVSEPVDNGTPAARLVTFARSHQSIVRKRALTFAGYAFPAMGGMPAHVSLMLTDTTNRNFHEHPYWPAFQSNARFPAHADIVVKQGSIEEWYLFNSMIDAHAFHIHQMSFVAEQDASGVPVTLDTVFVPPGKMLPNPGDPNYPLVRPSLVKILLDFRHVPRGTFVFHCHLQAHEDKGMMGVIRVE